MTLYSWGGGMDPSIRLQMSIKSGSPYNSWRSRPHQKQLDILIDAQAQEMNRDKRLVILKKIHKLLGDPSGGPVLLGTNMIYAHSSRIDYLWQPHGAFPYGLHRIKIVK